MTSNNTITLAATLGILAGCSTVGSAPAEPEPAPVVEPTNEDEPACTPSPLDVNDLVLPTAEASAIHSTYYEEWTVSTTAARPDAEPYTRFKIRLRKFRGSLAGGIGVGVYKIDGDDADLESCSTCVYVEESDYLAGETRLYVARSGILTVTDYHETAGVIHGALTDAELVPMKRETGGASCESQLDCPGAMGCDTIDTNTCFRPVATEGACTTKLDLVEF
ncbi:MAG: hypothetical protein KJO07_02170 [Deltaproteobacteria bacterium]|nr:hypothetical protein [Deltaproteobacteria bacterium]